jgi:hypothetical protein
MKKQFVSSITNVIRKASFRLGIASFSLFTFLPALLNAQDKDKPTTAVEIKYIGTVNNQPVFQIEFDNRNKENYNVSIKDEDGNTLYFERFKDEKFSKKFQFERTGIDDMKLTFTLKSEKEKQSQSYEVNTSVRVIQDVVVTRL